MVLRFKKLIRWTDVLHVVPMKSIIRQSVTVSTLLYMVLTPAVAGTQSKTSTQRLERVAALISGNQLVEAEQQLNQVLRNAPNDATALNLFGTIRAKQGRLKEAEGFFLRAIDRKSVV